MANLSLRFAFLLVLLATCDIGAILNKTEKLTGFEAEVKLLKKLQFNSKFRSQILPIIDRSNPVRLMVGLAIHRIEEVDELKQIIRVDVRMRLYWYNPFLSWNLEEYANITDAHLDKDYMWIPDICLYNKALVQEHSDVLYRRLNTHIVVDHHGNCSWLAPATLAAQCSIDAKKFPFDEHICLLTFGSWTYNGGQFDLNYVKKVAELGTLIPDSQWELVKTEFKHKVVFYPGSNAAFPDLTLEIRIKRLPQYYVINVIIPCVLIASLSFITFLLPTNHGERVSLVITILLAMSFYTLIISSHLPHSSLAIPDISLFFLCIIVEIVVGLLATCVTIRLEGKETKLPVWVDVIVNKFLGKLFGGYSGKKQNQHHHNSGHHTSSIELPKIVVTNGHRNNPQPIETQEGTEILDINKGMADLQENMKSELTVIADYFREKNARTRRVRKWKKTAGILDRFFAFVLVVFFAIIIAVFFH